MDEHQNPTVPADPFAPTVGLLGLIRIMLRWSFIVAPLVALSLWIAISQTEEIDPEYTAEAAMLLIGPSEVLNEDVETGEVIATEINPFNGLGGSSATFARVVALALSNSSVATQMFNEGLTPEVVVGAEARSPIMRLTATSADEDIAAQTVLRLTELVQQELQDRQDSAQAPESNRVTAQIIGVDVGGGPDFGDRNRVRLALAAVGLALSAASAFVCEGLLQLWKRRKARKKAAQNVSILPALPAGGPPVDRLVANRPETVQEMRIAERDTLVSTLHLQTGNERVAEAIAAEAFAAATEVWDRLKVSEPLEWLYGHAMFQAWAQPASDNNQQHPVDHNLWTTVQNMSQETRAVLALAHVAEFTNPRIAGALDMRLETVQKHRADASEILAGLSGGRSVDETLKASRRAAGLNGADQNGNGSGAAGADVSVDDNGSGPGSANDQEEQAGSTKTKQAPSSANTPAGTKRRGASNKKQSTRSKSTKSTKSNGQASSNGHEPKDPGPERAGKPTDPDKKR